MTAQPVNINNIVFEAIHSDRYVEHADDISNEAIVDAITGEVEAFRQQRLNDVSLLFSRCIRCAAPPTPLHRQTRHLFDLEVRANIVLFVTSWLSFSASTSPLPDSSQRCRTRTTTLRATSDP